MLEIALQMIICLLLAALVGGIIGYILGKNTCTDNDEVSNKKDLHQESAQDSMEPVLLSGARNGQKDNLTRIKGIGVSIEKTLNNAGIYHFDQISEWDGGNILWADNTLGFPGRAKRESWVEQAQLLATGKETEFSKRVDKGDVSSSKPSQY